MKNAGEFWADWEYDKDEARWLKEESRESCTWMFNQEPESFSDSYKRAFKHRDNIAIIKKTGWDVIHSLPVNDDEKGKQEWVFLGLLVDNNDSDKITAVFYESEFDVYREVFIVLNNEGNIYKQIDLYYESI